jgi:biopolymer transport protein ExbD
MARRLRREQRFMADINVTSLVDVMIVLLIMFMITAPMSQGGIQVRVPQTEGAPLSASEAIVVSMDEAGRVFIDRTEVRPEALGQALAQIRTSRGTNRVYVRADESNPYGRVMVMMNQLREAGFEDLGLVTEPPMDRER